MLITTLLLACSEEKTLNDGFPAFGYRETESPEQLLIADSSDGLNTPRDLGMNPGIPGELWVVNRTDDSVSIIQNTGLDNQDSLHLIDPYALHFMEEVSSIAFGKPQHFGTCQESMNTYNGQGAENTFMGPTLWHADLDEFAQSNPEAIEYLSDLFGMPVDLGSHYDMLHESPLCMGITWERENVYWVFDGYNESIVRYDFVDDHGMGYDDHSDGIIVKYVTGEVKREPDVPSHMRLDHKTGLLYVADTGNNAIKVLDITSGTSGNTLPVQEPGTVHFEKNNATFTTLIKGGEFNMVRPSGLTLIEDILLVSDNATGIIHAFDLEGNEIDSFQTGAEDGGLMGIYASSIHDILYVDSEANEVNRIRSAYSVENNLDLGSEEF